MCPGVCVSVCAPMQVGGNMRLYVALPLLLRTWVYNFHTHSSVCVCVLYAPVFACVYVCVLG